MKLYESVFVYCSITRSVRPRCQFRTKETIRVFKVLISRVDETKLLNRNLSILDLASLRCSKSCPILDEKKKTTFTSSTKMIFSVAGNSFFFFFFFFFFSTSERNLVCLSFSIPQQVPNSDTSFKSWRMTRKSPTTAIRGTGGVTNPIVLSKLKKF